MSFIVVLFLSAIVLSPISVASTEPDGTTTTVEIPDSYYIKEEPQENNWVVLVNNSDPAYNLDIVFISEDYGTEQLKDFADDVDKHLNPLFKVKPFSEHRNVINVHRVDNVKDLNASYDGRLIEVDVFLVKRIVNESNYLGIDVDVIMVLVNNEKYGGAGYRSIHVATASRAYPKITVHEFGHAFGNLWDEYVHPDKNQPLEYDPDIELGPNVDWDGSNPKWEGTPGTGAYLGATYPNLYRPTENDCLMRTLYPDGGFKFCPVCENHLTTLLEDPDKDKLITFVENKYGTDPLDPDTDGDGLEDDEAIKYGTDPLKKDTDQDLWEDKFELEHRAWIIFDPLNFWLPNAVILGVVIGISVTLSIRWYKKKQKS